MFSSGCDTPIASFLIRNIAGEKTGPASGQPPSTSQETTAAILEASKDDSLGQHEGGQGRGDKEVAKKIKSDKGRT